jgi:hypothetical protein
VIDCLSRRQWQRTAMATAIATLCVAAPARAETSHDAELHIKYRISFLGLDLARANMIIKVENGFYAARIGYKTTGIVKVFAAANGDISATGSIDGIKLSPSEFHQATKENSKEANVDMTLANGNVKSNVAVPDARPDPDRVPVKDENRRNVFDPLSAVLVPIGKTKDKDKDPLAGACDRSIPVFDGWSRFDIALSAANVKTVNVPGYKGKAVSCAVRWVPVAGHIPTRSGTKFMAENKNLDVTLAPIGDTGFLAPVHIGIQTLHGHIDVDAIEFKLTKEETPEAN